MTSSSTESRHETLEFGIGTTAPDSDALSVYATERLSVDGVAFDCRVIGSSHYITAPAIDFHEIASCRSVAMPRTRTVSLVEGCSGQYRYEVGAVDCELTIETRPLEAYPAEREFDLHYAFDERAVTAVDAREDGYETFHTYTEFDRTVYTRTRFDGLGRQ
ncbi:DUF2617 family protein [Haloarcula sp. S1CR25-12]|uniref:DUF2617 family protein n=1 Tax=Haloarcula saliterrae TaxID=2950534 RepID=A0ABU2FAJ5_9EURY|nr:DUF2617 family protein [Haloarcula sp. S1CR25-12]MDS0259302.1 DUF2617 family protein [Haloarcula sp. S1CR25-12]